ncbi:MAG: hypothetical protein ACOC1K_05870 [Nanoarchaeota archaeon]
MIDILFLTPEDLNANGKEKSIRELNYTDIANSYDIFKKANHIFYLNNNENVFRILKSRLPYTDIIYDMKYLDYEINRLIEAL